MTKPSAICGNTRARAFRIYIVHLLMLAILPCCFKCSALPGEFDTTFGGTGKVGVSFGGGAGAARVVLQSDGKILVAGSSSSGNIPNVDFALVRLNADGSLDTSFNGTGKIATAIGTTIDVGTCVAVQSDGKILVGGYSFNGSKDVFAVVRFTTNGALDTTFNGTGKATTLVGSGNGDDQAGGIAVQSDGKILLAGFAAATKDYFALVRYNSTGSLDTTFNGSGKVMAPIGTGNDTAYAIALQSNGKIVVAGTTTASGGGLPDFALARFNSSGTFDSTFGSSGVVVTPVGSSTDFGKSVTLQNDGKIIVAGYTYNGTDNDFALVRYTTTGILDSTFGGNGKIVTSIGGNDIATDVAVQADGKILAGGYSGSLFALVRYNTNGSLDTSFGGTGKVTTSFGNNAAGIALQSDGKIILAGSSSSANFALVRYQGVAVSPTATTLVATDVTTTAAALNGMVNPNGTSTIASFDYGLTTAYGFTAIGFPDPVNGAADTAILAYLSGLLPGSTYHFRVKGSNSVSVVNGLDQTFTTVNNDASLLNLVPNTGMLSPTFASSVTNYSLSVSSQVSTFYLTPTLKDVNATMKINNTSVVSGNASSPINLNFGQNTINCAVTAQDAVTMKTYMVLITRTFPDIAVEQPSGVNLTDGTATVDFGMAVTGATNARTFTIRNPGTESLSGISLVFDGVNASDFSTAVGPSASIAPGGSNDFTVNFAPLITGGKYAMLHLANNVSNAKNPFDVALTGVVLTHLQFWRQMWFGTTNSISDAADEFDFDNDGLPNLIEFATGQNPKAFSPPVWQFKVTGSNLEFVYPLSKGAISDGLNVAVEWTDNLDTGLWTTNMVSQSFVDQGATDQVTAILPAGSTGQRFLRLRVAKP